MDKPKYHFPRTAEIIAANEAANPLRRSPLALAMLCAWNNIPPDKAPPEWWNHPNDLNRQAWERVAKAARDYIEKEERG